MQAKSSKKSGVVNPVDIPYDGLTSVNVSSDPSGSKKYNR